jgi:mannosyltransferase
VLHNLVIVRSGNFKRFRATKPKESIEQNLRLDDESASIGYDFDIAQHGEGILSLPEPRGIEFVIAEVAKQNPRAAAATPDTYCRIVRRSSGRLKERVYRTGNKGLMWRLIEQNDLFREPSMRSELPMSRASEFEVIVASLKRRHTGVTSTVAALIPEQAKRLKIAALSPRPAPQWPRITWSDLFRHGFDPPPGKRFRIWHARRNFEALTGVILRSVLGMPLKLVLTSAAQRRHSHWTHWLMRQMDAVVATSAETAKYIPVPAKIISHGVDTARYFPSDDRSREWGGSGLPGRFGIAIFGRVRRQKGTDLFVEAMCRLLPKFPDYTAVIIGAVTSDQIPFARQLKSRIEAAGLSERIQLLGERPAAEIPLWFRRMSIVVSPQRWEGFGLVPLEGMASGCAVLATRVGAAYHVILDEHTGYLVSPEDLEGLVYRLEILMRDPQLTLKMGQAGRAHVVNHFSIEREAAELERVYESIWHGVDTGRDG